MDKGVLNETYNEVLKFENDSFNEDTRKRFIEWSNKIATLNQVRYKDELENIFQYIFPKDNFLKSFPSDCIESTINKFRDFLSGNYYIEGSLESHFEKLKEIFEREQVVLGDGLEEKSNNVLSDISKMIMKLMEEVEPIRIDEIDTNINEIVQVINILKSYDGQSSIVVKENEKILNKFFNISNEENSSLSVKVEGKVISKSTSSRNIDYTEDSTLELNLKRLEEEFIDFFGFENNEIIDSINAKPKGIDATEIATSAINAIPMETLSQGFISNNSGSNIGTLIFTKENIEIRDKVISIYNKIPEKEINILFKINFLVKRAILFKKLRELEKNPNNLNIFEKLKNVLDDERILSIFDIYTKNVYKRYVLNSAKIIFKNIDLGILKRIVLNNEEEWKELVDIILSNKIIRIKGEISEKKRSPINNVIPKHGTALLNMEDMFII